MLACSMTSCENNPGKAVKKRLPAEAAASLREVVEAGHDFHAPHGLGGTLLFITTSSSIDVLFVGIISLLLILLFCCFGLGGTICLAFYPVLREHYLRDDRA